MRQNVQTSSRQTDAINSDETKKHAFILVKCNARISEQLLMHHISICFP